MTDLTQRGWTDKSTAEFDVAAFICRCQPPHKSHIDIINTALKKAEQVMILLGSANKASDIKDPWTWRERKDMILACFDQSIHHRLHFVGIEDTYNDQRWILEIQSAIDSISNPNANICLIGHKKDSTSYYLDLFPQWKLIEISNIDDVHSTDIRRKMFELEQIDDTKIPNGILSYIEAFMYSEKFLKLKKEYEFNIKYRQQFASLKYEPIFVTVDALVICAGHVLLIRRRSEPGKNLFAISGGFVNANEKIENAVFRELDEECSIKVPEKILRGSVVNTKVYDAVNRSVRGRTITHVYLIDLPPQPDGKMPKIRAGDDAVDAKWVSFTTIDKMKDQFFEDHYLILQDMVPGL